MKWNGAESPLVLGFYYRDGTDDATSQASINNGSATSSPPHRSFYSFHKRNSRWLS